MPAPVPVTEILNMTCFIVCIVREYAFQLALIFEQQVADGNILSIEGDHVPVSCEAEQPCVHSSAELHIIIQLKNYAAVVISEELFKGFCICPFNIFRDVIYEVKTYTISI